MGDALRTVVVAHDRRCLRALARLLQGESRLQLCGFADDLRTAETVAQAVRAELLLLDAGMSGVEHAAWPALARRVFLVADGGSVPPGPRGAALCIAPERLAGELGPLLERLFAEGRSAGK